MKQKELTPEQKIDSERRELNLLIGKGITFDLRIATLERLPGWSGFLRKKAKVLRDHKFHIQEPTLSTLDRLATEQLDLNIDESVMKSDQGIREAKSLTKKHSKRLARIIAIAVLGSDYMIPSMKAGVIRYEFNDARLNDLTELFFHQIKPSKLFELVLMINALSNLGDFCNSIRLMSAERTTMPIRIEENKQD